MNESYWYETQERAMAPGIADGWPTVIKAPHTPHGRLVRRTGDPSQLLAALKEAENALADYIPTLEQQGAALNYGHRVLALVREAIAKAEGRQS